MQKILLAVDGSNNSLRAAQHVIKLNSAIKDLEVTVLSVYHWTYIGIEATEIQLREMVTWFKKPAEEALNKTVPMFDEAGIQVTTLIKEGEPGQVIVETATSLGTDLIVIGSRGLSKIKGLFLGSVSQKVMHLSRCPVTLVK